MIQMINGEFFFSGDSRSGDNSLVVSMELNGVTYQGVLFAQTPTNSRAALAS